MGLFLALSGVINASQDEVASALAGYARDKSGGFQKAHGSPDERNMGVMMQQGPHSTVLYPNGFHDWDEASRRISATLKRPVFSLHIHDSDLWMFILFDKGAAIDRFNPIPDYWEEVPDGEKAKWQGNASLIAQKVPGASAAAISNYFRQWDFGDPPGKAYPDDEFDYRDCWQMYDFMKRLGLPYPVSTNGAPLGSTFRLWTSDYRLRR